MQLCKALCKQIFHFVGSPVVAGVKHILFHVKRIVIGIWADRKLPILHCTVIMKIPVLKVCVTSCTLYCYDTVTLFSGDWLENCRPVGVTWNTLDIVWCVFDMHTVLMVGGAHSIIRNGKKCISHRESWLDMESRKVDVIRTKYIAYGILVRYKDQWRSDWKDQGILTRYKLQGRSVLEGICIAKGLITRYARKQECLGRIIYTYGNTNYKCNPVKWDSKGRNMS
jgi:hypothetical protein